MGQFDSYLGRVLCKTRLSFPRFNGPIVDSEIDDGFLWVNTILLLQNSGKIA